jgi:hypothetical protein
MFQVSNKFFALFTTLVFLTIFLVHGVRAFYGFDIFYAGVYIPIWISVMICILAVLSALAAIRQLK